MKKIFLLPGLILTTATILSSSLLLSCGGNSSDNKTIVFAHTFGKSILDQVQKQCTAFEKIIKQEEGVDVNIKLDYFGGYGDIVKKTIKTFSGGGTPTICVAYPDHVAQYLSYNRANKSYVNNLDSLFNDSEIGLTAEEKLNPSKLGENDFVDSFIDEGRHYINEGTYSLPYMKSTELMLYNKDLLKTVLTDMGIQQGPETYMANITRDNFMNILKYANEHRDKYFKGLESEAYPLFYDSDANLFITQCYQRNIPFISMKDGKGSIDFNNAEAKAMVQEIKDLHESKILITKGSNEGNYGSDFFKQKKALFVVGSTGGSGYSDPTGNFDVGVCKFPIYKTATEDTSKYVSQGVTLALLNDYSVSSEANDFKVKYGWKLMKYLTNTQNSITTCLYSEGYIPARYSCYEDESYREYLNESEYMSLCAKTVIDDIQGKYFNYPVFKGSDKARENVGGILTEYLNGKVTLEEAFNLAYNNTIKEL